MSSPIRLLIITNRYPAFADDGASPFVADFVAGIRRNGIDCSVLTPLHRAERYDDDPDVTRFGWGEEQATIGSLPVYRLDSWVKIGRYFANGYREAERLYREKRFDFCLALWAAPSGLIARRLYKNFRVPYAVWCLGSDIHTYARLPLAGGLIVKTLRDADRVYSDGYELGEAAQRLSGCECHFLPSLRKVREAEAADISNEAGSRETRLVCPGRVEKAKGVFDLLEAFQIVAQQYPEWSLVYIGEGSAMTSLRDKIRALGLGDRVMISGFLPRADMYRMIRRSAGVVIPTHADSLPLTFGEAMQLGRPVIASDVGDLKRFIEKYGVGMTVPARSPIRLAAAISWLISTKMDYSGRFGPCVEELDIDRAADRFCGWLENYLARSEGKRELSVC